MEITPLAVGLAAILIFYGMSLLDNSLERIAKAIEALAKKEKP